MSRFYSEKRCVGAGWLMIGIILGAVKTKGYKKVPEVLDL
jgi:hypothetical protein